MSAIDHQLTAEVVEWNVSGEVGEELRVVLWRASTLLSAGYDDDAALDLALDRRVDLHLAVELLTRGCPQDTAVRILV